MFTTPPAPPIARHAEPDGDTPPEGGLPFGVPKVCALGTIPLGAADPPGPTSTDPLKGLAQGLACKCLVRPILLAESSVGAAATWRVDSLMGPSDVFLTVVCW